MIQLCVADAFTGQYVDKAAFMSALADAINIECRREKVRHVTIDSVDWRGGDVPAATVCVSPGGSAGLASLERLRAAFAEQARRAQPPRSIRDMEEQGRLI